ncbi:MAG: response regulator [Planctomycetota bacterium]
MNTLSETPPLDTPVFGGRPEDAKRRFRPRHRVLWVDDDPNVAAAYARRLRRKRIEILPASDGMQGYWQAVTSRPDLIVTDLRMPRWQGGDLIECLRANAQTASIPLVVLSGYVTRKLQRELYDAGAASVLEKPVDPARLNQTLKRLLLPRR